MLNAKYQLAVSDCEAARRQLAEKQALHVVEIAPLRELAAEVVPLRQQLAQVAAQVADLEPLQWQLTELRAQAAELTTLRQQAAEVVSMRRQQLELKARLEELEPLRQQAAELEPLRKRLAAAAERQAKEVEALRKQQEEAEGNYKTVKKDLEIFGKKYDNLMKQYLQSDEALFTMVHPETDVRILRQVQPAVHCALLAAEQRLEELVAKVAQLEAQLTEAAVRAVGPETEAAATA